MFDFDRYYDSTLLMIIGALGAGILAFVALVMNL